MKKTQDCQWDMQLVTDQFCDGIPTETKDQMPQFVVYQALFKDSIAESRIQIQKQRLDRKGYKEEKAEAREELTVMGLDVSLKEQSYANNEGNSVLLNAINFTRSSLTRMGDTEFVAAMTTVFGTATENAVALLPYGVTALKITAIGNKIEVYEALIPTPKTGVNTQKAATKALKISIAKGMENLEKMDVLVRGMQITDPVFYSDYFQARHVGRPGYHILSLRGDVTDEAGVALQVKMKCESLGINRRTSAHGRFKFSNLAEGPHDITFSRPGFGSVTVRVNIFHGERVELPVVMVAH